MGACSVNIPTIVVSGGPMLTGKYQGRDIGTSDVWRFNDAVRSGEMSEEELRFTEARMARSRGHCAVMGTASTMACMIESLGLSFPQNAAIPAADSRRKVLAQLSGSRIVEMVQEDVKPSDILTRKAFENAIIVNAAIGGSTNFIIHLLAIAGRIGVDLTSRASVCAVKREPRQNGRAGNICKKIVKETDLRILDLAGNRQAETKQAVVEAASFPKPQFCVVHSSVSPQGWMRSPMKTMQ